MDVSEGLAEDPVVFGIVNFEAAVWGDAGQRLMGVEGYGGEMKKRKGGGVCTSLAG
jgi:hypothetical protein